MNIVQGAPTSQAVTLGSVKSYDYPYGLDLRPQSTLHQKIVSRVMRYADDAYEKNSRRFTAWNKIDDTLRVYIPTSEYEKTILKKDPTRPLSIVVPYSYANLETLMSYVTKAFLTDYVFQYDGASPSDTINAKLLELVVNQQVHRFKSILEMHTAVGDNFRYGYGLSTMNWAQRFGKKPQVDRK